MLKTESIRIESYYRRLSEARKYIDRTNVAILSCMCAIGPRNLLEVSRRTRIPFTTVYHRVEKLEGRLGRISHLVPTYGKLGLVNLVVINNAKPGHEDLLSTALKIPNYWVSVARCEGGFTHYSVHSVPVQQLSEFHRYLAQLSQKGLAISSKIIRAGDYVPVNLSFRHYDPRKQTWRFPWDEWVRGIIKQKSASEIDDPAGYPLLVNRRDLLIIKELQKDGRKTFAQLAPMLGITLQGVKYRYDRLTAQRVCQSYLIDVFPYPTEISATYEIMIDFDSKKAMNRFYSFVGSLFFVRGLRKIVGRSSLIVRVYILESQASNMFRFLSELAKRRMLSSYSALRLRIETGESQTVSDELFNDKTGWIFDYGKYLSELRKLS